MRVKITAFSAAAVTMAVVVSRNAFAATATGGSMPWESPLQTVRDSITGPVAYGVALIGIVAAGGVLIFGGEISEFTRRIIYLVLVAAILLGATSLVGALFTSAALVG